VEPRLRILRPERTAPRWRAPERAHEVARDDARPHVRQWVQLQDDQSHVAPRRGLQPLEQQHPIHYGDDDHDDEGQTRLQEVHALPARPPLQPLPLELVTVESQPQGEVQLLPAQVQAEEEQQQEQQQW
jgi:hypothetical protein